MGVAAVEYAAKVSLPENQAPAAAPLGHTTMFTPRPPPPWAAPASDWTQQRLWLGYSCPLQDSSYGDLCSQSPHLPVQDFLRAVLCPKALPTNRLPSFPFSLHRCQTWIMPEVSPTYSCPLSLSLLFILQKHFPQEISCISNCVLVAESQRTWTGTVGCFPWEWGLGSGRIGAVSIVG